MSKWQRFSFTPLLPIARGIRVALFGKGSTNYVKGGGGSPNRLKKALEQGLVTMDDLKINVLRILEFILKLD